MEVVRQVDRQVDVSDGCGGVRGRLIGHGEVSRNGQVSGNGRMGGSGQVIRVMSGSDQASGQTIGHDEWMQRDVGGSGQMQRGRQ